MSNSKKRDNILWRKQGGVCNACGRFMTNLGWPLTFTLDHILPLCLGGGHEEGNLQVLCTACHEKKTIGEYLKHSISIDKVAVVRGSRRYEEKKEGGHQGAGVEQDGYKHRSGETKIRKAHNQTATKPRLP